ncbi:hypothetical protein BGZ73_006492, partial [Actinomortierella ambigua]
MAIIATAQQAPVAPQPVDHPIYAKHKNKLYIYGGSSTALVAPNSTVGKVGQFFALDLSKPWRSASPAWIALPEGPRESNTGAAVSPDGKIFMTTPTSLEKPYVFNFDTKTWSMSNAIYPASLTAARPVTLGTNDTVLVAGGSPIDPYEYRTYSFVRDEPVLARMTDIEGGIPVFHEAVWSEHFKSAVFFGGFITEFYGPTQIYNRNGTVIFYHPEIKGWSSMAPIGARGSEARGFCLAI